MFFKHIKKYKMYYSVKLTWKQPKDGTDEMQKMSKQFLVYAESVTEAEMKMVKWVPRNYQDPIVDEVKKTTIREIKTLNMFLNYWVVKILEDGDGTTKPKPCLVVYNGNSIKDVIDVATKEWGTGTDIEEVKKFKHIIDDDLIGTEPISYTRKETDDLSEDNED